MSDPASGAASGTSFRMLGEPAEACAGGVCAWPPAGEEELSDAPADPT
ncbi:MULTISPECIES: hypothetical protein [Nocardiaceae]|nr:MULTISPECIES: hypothetical protein [Rhodococcus]